MPTGYSDSVSAAEPTPNAQRVRIGTVRGLAVRPNMVMQALLLGVREPSRAERANALQALPQTAQA